MRHHNPLISQTRIKLSSGWVAEFYLIGYGRINLLRCLGLRFKKLSEPLVLKSGQNMYLIVTKWIKVLKFI